MTGKPKEKEEYDDQPEVVKKRTLFIDRYWNKIENRICSRLFN